MIRSFHDLFFSNWDKLPEKVKEEIEKIMFHYKYYFARYAIECASPIEQMLLVHLLQWAESEIVEYRHYDKNAEILIEPQRKIEAKDKIYRIDIAIDFNFMDKNSHFAIECDGHEFHEKTKEQASKDKKRERDLMDKGYHVVRFTGSEIYKDASRCAWETRNLIQKISGFDEYMKMLIESDY